MTNRTAPAHPVSDSREVADSEPMGPGTGVWSAPRRAQFQRWLPAVAVLAATVVAWLCYDTSIVDIARFLLYVAWSLVLPGVLVYRAMRRVPHSLVDDLAMGTAVGFILELAAWAAYSAAGLQRLLWTWPAFVVALFLASPRLRRHWRTPAGYRTPSLGWIWAVAGIAMAMIAYLAFTAIGATPKPRNEAHWYYLDITYLLSLVTESMHHFPPHSPQVASEPLNYHWFAYAHIASSSLISGVEAPVVYMRFVLPLLCVVPVVLLAVVGWRVSGRPWVGVLASALMFITSEFTATDYVMFGMIGRWVISISPSLCYAWLSTIPLILVVVDIIRRDGLRDAPLGRGVWLLLPLFGVAAAGAKATILLVVLAGLALAGLAELFRRRVPWRIVVAGGALVGILVAATVLLYGGDSGGLKLSPFQILNIYIPNAARSTEKQIVVLGFVGVAYGVYILARLGGIPVLAWLSWRRRRYPDFPKWSGTEWFLLGAVLAGIAGTMLMSHITWAQIYVLRSAWPFGALLSAMGLAALVERYRVPRKVIAGVVVAGLVLAFAIVEGLYRTGLATPGPGVRVVLPIYWAAFGVLGISAVIVVSWAFLGRLTDRFRGVGTVLILVLVLLMGLPNFLRETYFHARTENVESNFYAEYVTPDGIAMTDWLRANTPADGLLATNGHCVSGEPNPNGACLKLTSWLAAYAERRVLVGGWGYVPRSAIEASKAGKWPGSIPFFDPPKLAANEAAFYHPTAAGLAVLRDQYGVGWLVVDRTVTPESYELRRLSDLRFERGDYAVYQIR